MKFACKNFNLDEVIKCSLDLTKSEFNLLIFLVKNKKEFTSEELSKKLKLDKSTIQRNVKKLHGKKLVKRIQKNKSPGGYVFYYIVDNKQRVKSKVSEIIDNWTNVFHEQIKNW